MGAGPAVWNRVYQRVRSTAAGEIGDWLRQRASARLDWMRYRFGADFSSEMASAPAGGRVTRAGS